MDYALNHRFNEENSGCVAAQDKRTFKLFKAGSLRKLLWSKSSRDKHWTNLAVSVGITYCCNVCRERPSRVWVKYYRFPYYKTFCHFNKKGLVSSDNFQLCISRRSCYVEHHHRSCFRDPYFFQHRDGWESNLKKSNEVLPFILYKDAHWRYCEEDSEGVYGSSRGCESVPACKFGFSLQFVQLNGKTMEQSLPVEQC